MMGAVVRATPPERRHGFPARGCGPYTALCTTEQARRRSGRPAAADRQACPARLPCLIAAAASPWRSLDGRGGAGGAGNDGFVGGGGGGGGWRAVSARVCVCLRVLVQSPAARPRLGLCALLWWTQRAARRIELVRGHLPPFSPHPPSHRPLFLAARMYSTRRRDTPAGLVDALLSTLHPHPCGAIRTLR